MDQDVIRRCLGQEVSIEMASACKTIVEYGKDDCVLFCSNPIWRVLGYDPAAEWRGRYSTREQALEIIGPLGLGFVLRRAAQRYCWKRIDPTMALAGDPALVLLPISQSQSAITTMICRAPGWFVARNEIGFTALKSNMARIAWSILP